MNNTPLGPKDPQEIKVLKFPFERDLNGATISTIQGVVVTVAKGIDVSPMAVLAGSAAISGAEVLQRMQGGISDVVYRFRVTVVDSAGNVHVMADTVLVQTL